MGRSTSMNREGSMPIDRQDQPLQKCRRVAGSAQYLLECLALLRPTGKEVYYKLCLRKFAPDAELTPEEKNPDAYIVRAFPSEQLKLF